VGKFATRMQFNKRPPWLVLAASLVAIFGWACSNERPDFKDVTSEAQSTDDVDLQGDGGTTRTSSTTAKSSNTGAGPDSGVCAPDEERECWENELGSPLPQLPGKVQGSCRRGVQTCSAAGAWGPCQGAVGPESEDSCEVSGADEDCNGVANEDCACTGSDTRDCGTDTGNCKLGSQTCNGSTWGDCEGGIVPADRDLCSVEGDDADCNGTPNEGCDCVEGETEACGECGTRACDAATGTWGECVGDGSNETCWQTPEGDALPGSAPTDPVGNCRLGSRTCELDGRWSPCEGAVAPQAEDTCAVGDDADCDGKPNEGCACAPDDTRPCGSDVGNCELGEQTCQDNATWGPCVGEVVAASADSCEAAGDDANCNGTPNEGCDCTEDSPQDCDDEIACTDDVCNNGVCTNPVKSGSCLIGGSCRNHNANDPSNACRYCDTAISQTAWTNWSSATSCSDGLWCNGDETCNGSGTCVRGNNRCPSSGPCVLAACDEANQECFKPDTEVCEESDEDECVGAAGTCGAAVQTRQVTRYCDGESAGCVGAVEQSSWTIKQECRPDQACSASSSECVSGGSACPVWCDTVAGVCWQTESAQSMETQSDAVNWCATRNWGGLSWRVPTLADWITVIRGCSENGPTGMMSRLDCEATCSGSGCSSDCPGSCNIYEGPASNGCYWPEEFVAFGCGAYWTSDESSPAEPLLAWVDFATFIVGGGSADTLCVVDQ
jgi:hypothetical protein